MNRNLFISISLLLIASCGGGGGGGGSTPTTPSTPAPTVNLSAEPTSVLLESTSTLTWSSSNANSCSASWTTQTGTSGSEAVTITTAGNNSFSITCTGEGGSGSASVTVEGYRETDGVVVDGYISGAEVCIDEDDSWTCDASENSTTSDNDGKFTIRYANGNLVSIGGTDLDSQTLLDNLLITHKLTGHSEFKAVTPVTSVAAFMEDASLVNAALGIDSSIDVFTFDPVANKGDGGINDYLYEKGNQLTVLAFALQNITNNLNTTTETTQDYFKAITEEIEKEYTETETKVDIETQAFVTKALDNVIAAKSVTIDETAKANTITALSGILPIIQVKSDDAITTEIIKFSISKMQTDITSIANGSADEDTVNSYTKDIFNFIADAQNLNADDLVPDIFAIDDNVTTDEDSSIQFNALLNDSFVISSTYSVTYTEPSNGSISLSGDVFNYLPNEDFNGTDTLAYTLTQSEKTDTANVNITINPVNDNPVINTASTLRAEENQTSVDTISVSDVDEDDLTLTLSGTDADSFNLSNENVLTFKEAPDYETKTSYSITFTLTDDIETVTKDVIIEIINLNDVAPEFTSDATFSVDENQKAIGQITATDVEGDDIAFSVSGNEILITNDGTLTFIEAPDYETKTVHTATVTASDGVNSTEQTITVNINNLNDNNPVFTSSSNLNGDENQISIATVSATDADGDSVTFTTSSSDLAITSDGTLSFISEPDFESVQTFTATITASDSERTTDQTVTVNVNNLNDNAPVYTADTSVNVNENQTSAITVTATDADGDAISYSISGGADKDSFSINSSSGVVTFNSAPDYETKNSYKVVVDVLDGGFVTSQEVTINIIDVNEPPVITSSDVFSADENQTAIDSVSASDPEGSSITYELSGADANSLSISSSGVLTFNSAPNFESKNTYSFVVNIGDGVNTTTQDIIININDINDVPVVTSASYDLDLLPQDQTSKTITLSGTDEDGDTLTYSIVSNGTYGTASFSQQSATETINVSVEANNSGSGNVYVIDGTQRKALNLNVGTTYTFNHPDAHPFRFSSSSDGTHGGGSEYTTGVTKSDGSTIIEVTSSTPTTLYYYCSVHSGMGASASMVNSNGDSSITYKTASSTQSSQSESLTFKVNDGTTDSAAATISIDLRTDPLYKHAWHLNNTGQKNFADYAGNVGSDINVDTVISDGYTGYGIKVAVVDEGLELLHEDLAPNIVDGGSYNVVDGTNDPKKAYDANDPGDHGTSVAGIISARGWNNIGTRGVAPKSSLAGCNLLENSINDNANICLGNNSDYPLKNNDIFNMSYGSFGTGGTSDDEALNKFAIPYWWYYTDQYQAWVDRVTNLRGGKGAIYVKSAGNGWNDKGTSSGDCGPSDDGNISCDQAGVEDDQNLPYTIVVAALDNLDRATTYSSSSSAMWVSGYGGEYGFSVDSGWSGATTHLYYPAIMTTDETGCDIGYVGKDAYDATESVPRNPFQDYDNPHPENPDCNYTSTFNGTSSAAPTVSGVIALMLEANSNLTWRDVKHILAGTSRKINSDDSYSYRGITQYSWIENSAGYEQHPTYGFGAVDAAAAISAAESYTEGQLGSFINTDWVGGSTDITIADSNIASWTLAASAPEGSSGIVEFIKLRVDFTHEAPETFGISLVSPGGIEIPVLQPFHDATTNPADDGTFTSAAVRPIFMGVSGFYGVGITGDWQIKITDYTDDSINGTVSHVAIKFYGR